MRWILGDQLGPHFTADLQPGRQVLMIESRRMFARRRYHRAKAHLILSAMRHRAADLGETCVIVRSDGFTPALAEHRPTEVIDPTSHRARQFVREQPGLAVLPSRGFATDSSLFDQWSSGRGGRRLLMEDWYRLVRITLGVLVDGDAPEGGEWNFDKENRLPPPKGQRTLGVRAPWQPVEDAIDAQVREDLDAWAASGEVTFIGDDGPRAFAATRSEALEVLGDFVEHRLASFGPYEDAILAQDWSMAHSLLSPALNLGLLHPMEVVDACVAAYRRGEAPLQSVEGMVRQILGWREYVWHLYWQSEPGATPNALRAEADVPAWFADLQDTEVTAACLSSALREVRERGWSHHIVRLMVLGNWALQRGYDPQQVVDWFGRAFVDGYPWVMTANVLGMSLYADGGRMATKPYASGGAYINRMSDHCKGCAYRPDRRVGPQACPFTAGYWWFLDRHREDLRGNHRMSQPLAGLGRLADRDLLISQEDARGSMAP